MVNAFHSNHTSISFRSELSCNWLFYKFYSHNDLALDFFLFNLVANNVSKEDIVFMIFSSIMLASIIFNVNLSNRTSERFINITSTECYLILLA